MHARTLHLLGAVVGVAPAEFSFLDRPVFRDIPHNPAGYGLIGGTGTIKTSQLVHRLAEEVEAIVLASPRPSEARFPCAVYARWLSWPEESEQLKRRSAMNDHRDLHLLINTWKEARQLYLDDIGQERVSSDNDYALGVFREVVDCRYRNRLPIFWTSNLDPVQLTNRYGARIMSRLFSAWPFIKVAGPDQRLIQMKRPKKA